MITWEQTNLPLPSSLTVKHSSSTQRKRTESGRYQIRKRYSTDYEEGSITFQFCDNDFQIFKGVWLHSLNNGADWFLIDLPVGGTTSTVQCKVRFISDYTYTYTNVGNSVVNAKIEFYRVETIDQQSYNNILQLGQTTPQTGENLYLWFGNVAGPDNNNAEIYIQTSGGLSSHYAVQKFDGTTGIYASGTFADIPIPAGNIGQEHRCVVWACMSATDSTPIGHITRVTCSQNNLTRADLLELTKCERFQFDNCDNLAGEYGNEHYNIPIPATGDRYLIRFSTIIESVRLQFFKHDSQIFDSFEMKYCNVLETFSVSSYDDRDVDIKTLSLTDCNLSGILNLRKVSFEQLFLFGNNISVLRINQLKGTGYLRLQNNNINQISLSPSTITGGFANLQNNYLNVDDIYIFIQQITVTSGTYTISVSGNPCWVNNGLDATHPDTAACLALASSKNIVISA